MPIRTKGDMVLYLARRATQSTEIHIPHASEGLGELRPPSLTGSQVTYIEATDWDQERVRDEEFQAAFIPGRSLVEGTEENLPSK